MHIQNNIKIALFLLVGSLLTSVYSYTITVPPSTSECFYEDLRDGDKMSLSYQVADSDSDINFKVFNSRSQIIYQADNKKENEYDLVEFEVGRYEYCFLNVDSTSKRVMWNVRGLNKPVSGQLLSDEGVGPIRDELYTLIESINDVRDQQLYMRARERAHRDISESTNGRVKWWSILQSGLLIAVCVFQIIYLKHFFEVRHKHGI